MRTTASVLFAFFACVCGFAQMTPPHIAIPVASDARPDDVKSVEALVAALYDVISGPTGVRDWTRFRTLCIPQVRFIRNSANAQGVIDRAVMSLEDFQRAATQNFNQESFYERGVHNTIEQYGTIAQVFSTYESSHDKDGKAFERGINSMQFVHDGRRWWTVTILWDKEGPGHPIPQKYLK